MPAFEDDIAAGDVSADFRKSGLFAEVLEIAHWQLARTADVDGTKQGDEDGHRYVLKIHIIPFVPTKAGTQ